jgi:hypothetical protein
VPTREVSIQAKAVNDCVGTVENENGLDECDVVEIESEIQNIQYLEKKE